MSEADGATTDTEDNVTTEGEGGDAGSEGQTDRTQANADAGSEGQGADGAAGEGATGQDEGSDGEGQGGYWPEDWRERMAEHASAGDQKAYERELTRLQRYADPSLIYSARRELENTFNSGKLVKLPGEDSTDDEIQAYREALGVPEKSDGYLDMVHMEEGLQIGESDVPNLESFLEEAHEMGASPQFVEGALNWYFRTQADMAASMDEMDDRFQSDSDEVLREEYGTRYRGLNNAIDAVFAQSAPGGGDRANQDALISRMAGARFEDGTLVSADADYRRFMIAIAQDRGFMGMTNVDDYGDDGRGLDQRLEELAEMRRSDKKQYYTKPIQDEEEELLARKAARQG